MARLFLAGYDLFAGQTVNLTDERHHYLAHVLRARPGTPLELFSGDGRCHAASIVHVARRRTELVVGEERPALPPSRLPVTLWQSVLAGGRTEWVVQKSTELGVAAINIVYTARCKSRRRRLSRLQAVAIEAAEQCGRAEVPPVGGPFDLLDLPPAAAAAARFIFWEEARAQAPLLSAALEKSPPEGGVELMSGPEGGLTAAEVEHCRAEGFEVASLGPRVLRAETASIVAVTIAQTAHGELGR